MTEAGHNSGAVNAGQLKAFIERIESVEETIREHNASKSDIYSEVKSVGYDVKAVKHIIAIRRKPEEKRIEEEAILDVYLLALGMV